MIYIIHCGKIMPWTSLEDVAEYPQDDLVQGTCPTCKSSFTYKGRQIVGFEANDYYFCLACVAYKSDEFEFCEPVFANKRHWKNIHCDICGETLAAGRDRRNQP